MVENIEKLRNKVTELLKRIYRLENTVAEKEMTHESYVDVLALEVIGKLDKLRDREPGPETNALEQDFLDILEFMGVHRLANPIDKIADFTHPVGTVKDLDRRNGVVTEVVKPGYGRGENLVRPTHVIIVKND